MRFYVAALALFLSGCGVSYNSPSIQAEFGESTQVRVLPITPSSVIVANRSGYAPKALPSVFNAQGKGLSADAVSPVGASQPQQRPASLTRNLPPTVQSEPYKIGVGDVLLLATPQAGSTVEELSGLLAAQNRRQGYTVQDDGAIAIPDVGRVQVGNLTLEQAEDAMFQALVERQIEPSFSLEVAEFNSKRVSIGGAVGAPGIVPITLKPLYLEEALANAGGLSAGDLDYASVQIYRDNQLYQIPVRDIYEGRADRIQLIDGDTVFVDTEFQSDQAREFLDEQIKIGEFNQSRRNEARSNFRSKVEFDAVARDYVYLVGEVNNQGRVALPFGRQATLADVLFGGGSFNNETANPRQVYVLRGSADPREFSAFDAWQLDGRKATNFIIATRFEMRPNDIVFVAQQPITKWNRVVSQITPALISAGARVAN